MNLNIKNKILSIVVLSFLAMVIMSIISFSGFKKSNHEFEGFYNQNVKRLTLMGKIMSLMRDNRIQLLLALQHNPTSSEITKLHKHPIQMHTDQINFLWEEYEKTITNKDDRKRANNFAEKRKSFVKNGLIMVRESLLNGDFTPDVENNTKKVILLFEEANKAAEDIVNYEKEHVKTTYEEINKQNKMFSNINVIVLIIAISFIGIICFNVISYVTKTTNNDKLGKIGYSLLWRILPTRLIC